MAILALALACAATPSAARDIGILVPAYFAPGSGGSADGQDGWAEMAASAGAVSITAILNPANGPGPQPDPRYAVAVAALERAGGAAVGYVDTGDGSVPAATVETMIQTWLTQYPGLIDGFFLDQMSTSPAQLPYYQGIADFVRSLGPSYRVIGNPGVRTIEPYASTANALVTFEEPAAAYPGSPPPGWAAGWPRSTFGAVLYAQPTAAGMTDDIALADGRGVGFVYVTDQTMHPSTGYLYDRLPSYWDQEVATVAAAAPEPGSMILVASGLAAMAGAAGLGWRRRAEAAARA